MNPAEDPVPCRAGPGGSGGLSGVGADGSDVSAQGRVMMVSKAAAWGWRGAEMDGGRRNVDSPRGPVGGLFLLTLSYSQVD